MRKLFFFICIMSTALVSSQQSDNLPYYQIPEYPESYTSTTVVVRMIDGLGFRYRWATEGLTEENLSYKPSESGRTIEQTLEHLFGLSSVIYNAARKMENDFTKPFEKPGSLKEVRERTLNNFKMARELLMKAEDLSAHEMIFKNPDNTAKFPFWNMINGPIEDAVWHCGQVVMLRRAAGNPMAKGVSVLRGVKSDF